MGERMTADTPLLRMKGIRKRFPGVTALDDVDFEVRENEVVGLIGENGAGKSTLMKILGGVLAPTAGNICIAGEVAAIGSVSDAMRLGIGFIHQELNILDNIDVAGNIFFGREPRSRILQLIDRDRIESLAQSFLDKLGLSVSPSTPLAELSIAQQQMVEIAKALSLDPRILVMDEPTSSLTLSETETLLKLVGELRGQGVSVIYISHRLSELNAIADRVVVLRDGKNVGTLAKEEISHERMVNLMIGRDIENFYVEPGGERTPGYFKAAHIRSRAYPAEAVSFEAARGEILGFAGLVGAGRTEMAEAIFGIDTYPGGEVSIGTERIEIASPRDAIAHGIYLVTEDRRLTGLITEMTVRENITLPAVEKYATLGLIDRAAEAAVAEKQKLAMDIKMPGTETTVMNLSGGNQQKVVLGRWLSMDPKVIFFDEPTRGIDVKTKADIYRIMRDLAEKGTVVVMISSDMEEILHVSDRIAVMHEGRIAGILGRPDCSEQNVMKLAFGENAEARETA
jgi:ribose transport system ATP-binding protein